MAKDVNTKIETRVSNMSPARVSKTVEPLETPVPLEVTVKAPVEVQVMTTEMHVEPIAEMKPIEVINPEIERRRKFDSEIVSGTFNYTQVPGGTLEFYYKKYKGDPIKKYSFVDGQHYNIPRGVANHLNDNCGIPVHQYIQDEKGTPIAKLSTPFKRFMFSSDFGVYKPETRLSVVSKL